MTRRVLVLGGGRSGKSRFAESLFGDVAPAEYLATAPPHPADPEWVERVRVHRERRGDRWRTLESGDAASVLESAGPPVLVESVTAWLARAMDECRCWTADEKQGELDARLARLDSAWAGTPRFAVAVSDEVGLGVVPDTASGRRFRDTLGLLNQRLAATADEVHVVVAGLPLRLR
jgi:adenosylcobinamide kinase / adenosylcobinamide-phosphate guanylyltransferase